MIQWIRNLFSISKQNVKIEELESIVNSLAADHDIIIDKLSEISVYCDKCNGGENVPCFKCNNTGIIKNKQLYDWPW